MQNEIPDFANRIGFVQIKYTLTEDEYLEMFEGSLPELNLVSFAFKVAVALALGTLGFLIDSRESHGGMAPSVIFWIAIALLLFAIYDLRVRPRERKSRELQALRFRYKHFYDREQSFEFDRYRWRHEMNSVRTEATWSSVAVACELKLIMWFRVNDLVFAVPNRALDQEALASLREAMIRPGVARLDSKVGFWDYLSADIPELWRRKPGLRLWVGIGGVLLVFSTAEFAFGKSSLGGFAFTALVAVCFITLVLSVQFSRSCLEYFSPSRSLMRPNGFDASSDGVCFSHPDFRFFVSWSELKKSKETKHCVLLFIDEFRYYIVSKRNGLPDQLSAFRQLLGAKLG